MTGPSSLAAVRKPYDTVAADHFAQVDPPAERDPLERVALTGPGHRGRTYALTGPEPVTARQQVEAVAAALGREAPFAEIGRQEAHAHMAAGFGAEAADAVLDVTGGDVNDEPLRVRDTVAQVTGTPARPFRQWAAENAPAFSRTASPTCTP